MDGLSVRARPPRAVAPRRGPSLFPSRPGAGARLPCSGSVWVVDGAGARVRPRSARIPWRESRGQLLRQQGKWGPHVRENGWLIIGLLSGVAAGAGSAAAVAWLMARRAAAEA